MAYLIHCLVLDSKIHQPNNFTFAPSQHMNIAPSLNLAMIYKFHVSSKPNMEFILRHTIPFQHILPLLTRAHEILSNQQTSNVLANDFTTGFNFTAHVFLNGVTSDNLPTYH